MAWQIDTTDEFDLWFARLMEDQQDSVLAAIEKLEEYGPRLGRPFVDTLKGSRHKNMKELRPPKGHLRVLFAFDLERTAILLVGGDKTNRWSEWYKEMIPIAEQLLDRRLARQRERRKGDRQ